MRVKVPALLLATTLAPLPAHADGTEWAGVYCRAYLNVALTSARVTGGPWVAADVLSDDLTGPGHMWAPDILVHCVLQSTDVPGAADAHSDGFASVHASGTGVVAAVSELLPLPATGPVYLCTYVEMVHDGSYDTFVGDSDGNPANGVTCTQVR